MLILSAQWQAKMIQISVVISTRIMRALLEIPAGHDFGLNVPFIAWAPSAILLCSHVSVRVTDWNDDTAWQYNWDDIDSFTYNTWIQHLIMYFTERKHRSVIMTVMGLKDGWRCSYYSLTDKPSIYLKTNRHPAEIMGYILASRIGK